MTETRSRVAGGADTVAPCRRSGMTLVELVVFMFLASMVMSGLFSTLSRAIHMDYAVEQRTAAFFHCKSVLEKLRTTPFDEIATPKNGFKDQKDGTYVRIVNEVPFHTQGGTKHTELKATETTTLVEGSTDDISHYTTTVALSWNTDRGKKKNPVIAESITTVLYP